MQLFFCENNDLKDYKCPSFPLSLAVRNCYRLSHDHPTHAMGRKRSAWSIRPRKRLLEPWLLPLLFQQAIDSCFRSLRPLEEPHFQNSQSDAKKIGLRRFISPTVGVLSDPESPLATACKRAGLWVIEASPYDTDFLKRTAVSHANEVFIFGDDSVANLDLALRSQSLPRRTASPSVPRRAVDTPLQKSDRSTVIYVAIEDCPMFTTLLQPHTVGPADFQGDRCHLLLWGCHRRLVTPLPGEDCLHSPGVETPPGSTH